MIRTAILAAAVALLMGATAALSFQQTSNDDFIGVDVATEGNSANTVGAIDSCRSAAVGDTFDIDIVAKGIPPVTSPVPGTNVGGVAGFGYNLHFDPAVINVTAVSNTYIIQTSAPFEFIAANYTPGGTANPLPATTGDMRIDYVTITQDNIASGDGVLSRVTVKVVGAGTSALTLDDEIEPFPYPVIYGTDATAQFPETVGSAVIKVGSTCSSADAPTPELQDTPTPTPTPIPTASSGATPLPSVPAGDTKVAIDAVTTGNQPAKLGNIDSCASASVGERFTVDVVIQDVTNLLAWELPVSFDPRVLRVEDRDVKQFQAANDNSSVIDASQTTPNDTGVYVASAVDSGDPPSPDSGSGVLVRLTFTALAAGTTPLTLTPVDINNDNVPDRGLLLKNSDNAIIGDTTGDTYFDGPATPAEIRVGAQCPNGQAVVQPGDAPRSEDSGSNTWVYVAIAAAGVVVLAGASAGFMLMRRRRKTAP